MSYLIEDSLFKKDLQKPKESALTRDEGDPTDPDEPDPNIPAGAAAILGAGAAAALEVEPTVRPNDQPTNEEREARAREAHWERVDRWAAEGLARYEALEPTRRQGIVEVDLAFDRYNIIREALLPGQEPYRPFSQDTSNINPNWVFNVEESRVPSSTDINRVLESLGALSTNNQNSNQSVREGAELSEGDQNSRADPDDLVDKDENQDGSDSR